VLYEDPDWVAGVVARIPAGRTGERGDLDGALIFLASEAASYVTGQLLFVDGGFSTGAMSADAGSRGSGRGSRLTGRVARNRSRIVALAGTDGLGRAGGD
jgi:hypothetical protein